MVLYFTVDECLKVKCPREGCTLYNECMSFGVKRKSYILIVGVCERKELYFKMINI